MRAQTFCSVQIAAGDETIIHFGLDGWSLGPDIVQQAEKEAEDGNGEYI